MRHVRISCPPKLIRSVCCDGTILETAERRFRMAWGVSPRNRLRFGLLVLMISVARVAALGQSMGQSMDQALLPNEVSQLSEEELLAKWSELAEQRRKIRAMWEDLRQQQQRATGQRREQIRAQFDKLEGPWRQQISQLTSQMRELSVRVYHHQPNDPEAAELAAGRLVEDCSYEGARQVCQQLTGSGRQSQSFLNASAAVSFAFHDFANAEQLLQSAANGGGLDEANQQRLAVLATCAQNWKNEQAIRQREAAAQADQRLPRVLLTTTQGDLELELFEDQAPNTVANFIRLVEDRQYERTLIAKQSFARQVVGGNLGTRLRYPGRARSQRTQLYDRL